MALRCIQYDDANMLSEHVGRFGAKKSEWDGMLTRLKKAKRAVLEMSRTRTQGFLDLPSSAPLRNVSRDAAERLKKKFTDLVVLGIGGSDLGARALHDALVRRKAASSKNLKLHFAGSSTDPDELHALIRTLDLKRTCVNVISKSGGTLETMVSFLVFRDLLIKRVGRRTFHKHIIATTDPQKGSLHDLSLQEGYEMLPVPNNVGGRFSVLSPVGLLPAVVSGIDIDALCEGARVFVKSFKDSDVSACASCRYAGLHVIGYEKRNLDTHVLMAYSNALSEFTTWVRQLVAESLGKRLNRKKKEIFTGPTPVAAIGPEDQHSQLQLYAEGPFNKLITFMEVGTFDHDLVTPDITVGDETIRAFGNKSFRTLIHTERAATAESLRRMKRPNGTITLNGLHERAMGEVIMMFEIAVALMGELMDVNAYDQPGVELSKQLMRESLS